MRRALGERVVTRVGIVLLTVSESVFALIETDHRVRGPGHAVVWADRNFPTTAATLLVTRRGELRSRPGIAVRQWVHGPRATRGVGAGVDVGTVDGQLCSVCPPQLIEHNQEKL